MAVRLDSEHWSNYVSSESFDRLRADKKSADARKLTVFSFLNPSIFDGFRSVLIAGACFPGSILYQSFSKSGAITFRPDEDAAKTFRFNEHPNGETVEFIYATEKPWSKRLRDRNKRKDYWEPIIKGVNREFADQTFVWSANKDIPDDLFGAKTRLPQSPYGTQYLSACR